MSVRRVVTGHDRDGKAVFVSDEQVDPVTVALRPDRAYHRLWGADQLPTFPDDGRPPEQHNYFPPVGGYRFGLFTVLPGTTSAPDGLDRQAAPGGKGDELPAFSGYLERGNPGVDTTDT